MLQPGQELGHGREHPPVVAGRRQHQPAVPEGPGHRLRPVPAGEVHGLHRQPPGLQQLRQLQGGPGGVPVDGGVGHQHALLLRDIAAPEIVLLQGQGQPLPGQHRAVEGAHPLDVQRRRLFQQGLHLHAVLAHNVQVVPPPLVHPGGVRVGVPEAAEAVGGEQGAAGLLKGQHHLRPVHHGGHGERQGVLPQGQLLPLLHHQGPIPVVQPGESRQHGEGLGVAHQLHVWVLVRQDADAARVIRLHVVDDQVIWGAALQDLLQVGQPLLQLPGVHRVQHRRLLVQDHPGVVADAVGHGVLAFKQIQIPIEAARRADCRVKCGIHYRSLPSLKYGVG